MHGCIREVSLVLAGANPGAFIDAVMSHGEEFDDGEGTIFTGEPIELRHADDSKEADENGEGADKPGKDDGETIQDVIDSMSEKQKNVLYGLIGAALGDESGDVKHADGDDDGETVKDVFDTLSEKQKNVVYALIGQALEENKKEETR